MAEGGTQRGNGDNVKEGEKPKPSPIIKVFPVLVKYMEPIPILDLFMSDSDLFTLAGIRDIMEETKTSNRNRQLLQKVTQRGDKAYVKLKHYLHETGQGLLVQLLEMTEMGENTVDLVKHISDMSATTYTASKERGIKDLSISKFQKDLIAFYRHNYNTISVSPLLEQHDVPLLDFYVQPPMEAVDLRRRFGKLQGMPATTPIKSYHELFVRDDGTLYKDIYVVGKAGYGKTSFAKRICLAWCQAHDPDVSDQTYFKEEEELRAMKMYEFLFLVSLRDVDRSACDLEKFIEDSLPYKSFDQNVLQKLLRERPCLVILDGLDEWNHPQVCTRSHNQNDIPHRAYWTHRTVLTTTRPWMFDVLQLPSTKVDRHIEIKELDDTLSRQLVTNAMNLLGATKSVDEFYKKTEKLRLEEVRNCPYIHLQFVCIWFDGMDIGRSRCDAYTNIIEFTLKRGQKKMNFGHLPAIEQEQSTRNIPVSMKGKKQCELHFPLLLKLGQLAFYSLFDADKRQMLVFDAEFARRYLGQQELDYCLRIGLLSQNKVYGPVSYQPSSISFSHKSVHEFLAALYLQSDIVQTNTRDKNMQDIIVNVCNSTASILNMANVFIFLSGMHPQVYRLLSNTLINTVAQDAKTIEHRTSLTFSYTLQAFDVMFDFQTMQVECIQEMKNNGHDIHPLPLEDVIISEKSKHEQYWPFLQTLIQGKTIKSLFIDQCEDITNYLTPHILHSLNGLQKLHLDDVDMLPGIDHILQQSNNSLISLYLNFNVINDERAVLSGTCEEAIINMPLLQSLCLSAVQVSHNMLSDFAALITSRVTMTQIALSYVQCRDHGNSCMGVGIDLSQHKDLRLLHHVGAPISLLDINTEHLEEFTIGALPNSEIRSCIGRMRDASYLTQLMCHGLSVDDLHVVLETIPALSQLDRIFISDTDLGDSRLVIPSDNRNLQGIVLVRVSVTSSALRHLLDSVNNLTHAARVTLSKCTVTPREEYEAIKDDYKTSGNLKVYRTNEINPHYSLKIEIDCFEFYKW